MRRQGVGGEQRAVQELATFQHGEELFTVPTLLLFCLLSGVLTALLVFSSPRVLPISRPQD